MMMVLVGITPGIHTMQVLEVVNWKTVVRYIQDHLQICVIIISCTALVVLGTPLLISLNNVDYRHSTVPVVPDTPVPIWHNSVD